MDKLMECSSKTPVYSLDGRVMVGKCVRVIDGDTVDVAVEIDNTYTRIRVRLLDVYAPEIKGIEKLDGAKSKAYTQERLDGQLVVVKCGMNDSFGRVLGIIYTLVDFNQDIVRMGLATKTKK